jgi:acetyltransferase-like isoleucine patch superfamily enzyme
LHTIFSGLGLMTIGFGQTCDAQVSGVVVGHGVVVGQGVVVGAGVTVGGGVKVGAGVVVKTKQQVVTEQPYDELHATLSAFLTFM